ncbi:hypothetical protein RB195_019890 [Necator americanus]|uniref:Uncharacterized protein n=1 Tax=Necator americanus TaxID=51031 RepID=A0ABR1CG97_NECAM
MLVLTRSPEYPSIGTQLQNLKIVNLRFSALRTFQLNKTHCDADYSSRFLRRKPLILSKWSSNWKSDQ